MSGPFDDLIPQKAPGAIAPKGMIYSPPADSLGQQQKAAQLRETQQRTAITAATTNAQITRANAEAAKAQLDLKNAQQGNGEAWGDPNLSGADRLASVPAEKRGLVQLLINNKLPQLSSFALAKPQMQSAINTAVAVDPTFDPSLMGPRSQALKDFTGAGKASNAIGAVNRLAANLQELKSVSDKMGGPNTGVAPLNKLIAGTEQEFEPTLKAKYDTLLPEIATQFDLIMKSQKGSATVSGIQEALNGLSRARSQDERNAAFQEVGKAIHGAIAPLKEQWDAAYGGTKAPPMWISKGASDFFSSLDPANADDYGGKDWRGLPGLKGDGSQPTPFGGNPPPGGGAPPPAGPPSIGGAPPAPPGGLGGPRADYSGMVGGPNHSAVTADQNSKLGALQQTYKNVYDPVMAGAFGGFIRKGVPYETAAAFAQSHGFNPPSRADYTAAVAYQQDHPNAAPNVESNRSVPTTLGERLATSPAAAAVAGFGSGSTAGLQDVVGRAIAGQQWDGNKAALDTTQSGASTFGNVLGGVAGSLAAPELLSRFAPGAAAKFASLAKGNPLLANIASDAAYGGTYGASENPDHPVAGGLLGALTGAGAGYAGRKVVGGLSNVIAPDTGNFGPLYDAGVFPTPGQRFGNSGVAGRALSLTEQAMQSVPGLGALPAAARQSTRDAFQTGAFNNSLIHLEPFGQAAESALPKGVGPGTAAHAFTSDQFDKAYDVARSGMQFAPDSQFAQDFGQWQRDLGKGILTGPQQQQVQSLIQNVVGSRMKNGVLDGAGYKAAGSDIGRAISAWGRDPAKADMANALGDFGTIFDNGARRASGPQASALLDAADRGYAQLVRIQRASEMGGAAKDAGTFTPTNYAAAVKQQGGGVRSSAYNQGNALGQDYAQAGLNLSDKLADSGTPIRLGVLGALQGAEGAGLAATGHLATLLNPKLIGAFAPYIPGVRDVVNRAIAPNAQRLSFMPPPAVASIDALGSKIDDLAPFIGKGAIPGALAYFGGGQ